MPETNPRFEFQGPLRQGGQGCPGRVPTLHHSYPVTESGSVENPTGGTSFLEHWSRRTGPFSPVGSPTTSVDLIGPLDPTAVGRRGPVDWYAPSRQRVTSIQKSGRFRGEVWSEGGGNPQPNNETDPNHTHTLRGIFRPSSGEEDGPLRVSLPT